MKQEGRTDEFVECPSESVSNSLWHTSRTLARAQEILMFCLRTVPWHVMLVTVEWIRSNIIAVRRRMTRETKSKLRTELKRPDHTKPVLPAAEAPEVGFGQVTNLDLTADRRRIQRRRNGRNLAYIRRKLSRKSIHLFSEKSPVRNDS